MTDIARTARVAIHAAGRILTHRLLRRARAARPTRNPNHHSEAPR